MYIHITNIDRDIDSQHSNVVFRWLELKFINEAPSGLSFECSCSWLMQFCAAATLQIECSEQFLTAVHRCFADPTSKLERSDLQLMRRANADLQGSIAEFLSVSIDFEAGSVSFAKVCGCFQLGVPHLAFQA